MRKIIIVPSLLIKKFFDTLYLLYFHTKPHNIINHLMKLGEIEFMG